jgi:Tol biopolymer transport system component
MNSTALQVMAIALGLALVATRDGPQQASVPVTSDGLVVFSSDRDGTFRLYSCKEDGSDVQLATKGKDADAFPAWSPSGDRIAFVSGKSLTLLDWKTKTRQSLDVAVDPEMCLLSWSPEGDRILCNSGDELVIVDVATKKTSKAVDPKVMKECGTGTWMPDGKTLLVSSGSCAPTLRTLATNGTVAGFLTTTPMFTFVPQLGGVWSTATPHRCAFTAFNLADVKMDDAMKKRLLDLNSGDDVTPSDLAAIDMGDVYVTAEDGRNPTKVFSTPGLDWAWGWSPDGQALLVTSTYMIPEEVTAPVAGANKHADADLFIVWVGTDRKINLTKDAALERGASWRPLVASLPKH